MLMGDIQKLDQVEAAMLQMPQAECPVVHHFGPGVYMREVTLKARTLAIGHAQKKEHLNIMLTGAVSMVDNGQVKIVKAPLIYVGKPGRKVGYVLEDTVWLNVYSTDETDIEKLEEMFLDKSETWKLHNESMLKLEHDKHQADRNHFKALIESAGFNEEMVRQQSENEDDQMPMPEGYAWVTVRPSAIEGKGVFLSSPFSAGAIIGPARVGGKRTPLGRSTNHSMTPNARFIKNGDDIWMIALRDIDGCRGGDQGEEVTVDYKQSLQLIGELECQA
jgi:stress-induced morphogen